MDVPALMHTPLTTSPAGGVNVKGPLSILFPVWWPGQCAVTAVCAGPPSTALPLGAVGFCSAHATASTASAAAVTPARHSPFACTPPQDDEPETSRNSVQSRSIGFEHIVPLIEPSRPNPSS